ncbi:MAG TPA: porin family protein [Tenuifilaceae bacterium]|jgi:opacity protein-like surface antigen|nr:porin family protein [Tenuifilaceae bacterium]
MKKCIVFLLLIAAIPAANAQLFKIAGQEVGFVYVGPRMGMNFSQISNWTEFTGVENKSRIGYQFGVVGELGFTNRFSVDGELVFASRGHKQTFEGGNTKYNVSYFGIPLLAKYSLKILGVSKVYLKGGTFMNVRTSGDVAFEYDTGEVFEEELDPEGWRRVDWGMAIGAGAEYELEHGIIGLDLRYNQSFVDVHTSDPEKNRNRGFGISVTYKYDLVDLMLRIRKKKLDPDAE